MSNNEQEREQAKKALGVLSSTIYIVTDSDLTPLGKRRIAVVKHRGRKKIKPSLALYVGRRLYRLLELTATNIIMAEEWVKL